MTDHTFLFEPGLKRAQGWYYPPQGDPAPLEGETRIVRQPGIWINEGRMRIQTDPPAEFGQRYEIHPFPPGGLETLWPVDPQTYQNRGAAYRGQRLLSAWTARLTRLTEKPFANANPKGDSI
jgi:hypothetical protein